MTESSVFLSGFYSVVKLNKNKVKDITSCLLSSRLLCSLCFSALRHTNIFTTHLASHCTWLKKTICTQADVFREAMNCCTCARCWLEPRRRRKSRSCRALRRPVAARPVPASNWGTRHFLSAAAYHGFFCHYEFLAICQFTM